MKISKISSNLPFRSKIIDSHVHTGYFINKFYEPSTLDCFIKNPLEVEVQGHKQLDSIEAMLVSNLSCLGETDCKDETEGNLEMLEIADENDFLYPLAVCKPKLTDGDTTSIEKLLSDNPDSFVGLKFHPSTDNLRADDKRYDPYLDMAEKYNLPCLFHSEVKLDWSKRPPSIVEEGKESWSNSDPEFIYELARRHPSVPVIMAHLGAGGSLAHEEAISVLLDSIDNDDAKLYCDISWVDFERGLPTDNSKNIITLIEELKKRDALDRVMFGTDAPLGCYGEKESGGLTPKEAYEKTVSTLKTTIKNHFPGDSDEIIQKIFFDNANNLFLKKGDN